MSDSDETRPTSIFEAARLGWNVQLTCLKCGHRRVLHAAALWLTQFKRGKPDDLGGLSRRLKCSDCWKRGERINRPRLKLVRDPPDGEPLRLPTDAEWKDGLRWQRR